MLRRIIAGVLAASTWPIIYMGMWVLPDIAFGLFFLMLIAPLAVWEGIMEGHGAE